MTLLGSIKDFFTDKVEKQKKVGRLVQTAEESTTLIHDRLDDLIEQVQDEETVIDFQEKMKVLRAKAKYVEEWPICVADQTQNNQKHSGLG